MNIEVHPLIKKRLSDPRSRPSSSTICRVRPPSQPASFPSAASWRDSAISITPPRREYMAASQKPGAEHARFWTIGRPRRTRHRTARDRRSGDAGRLDTYGYLDLLTVPRQTNGRPAPQTSSSRPHADLLRRSGIRYGDRGPEMLIKLASPRRRRHAFIQNIHNNVITFIHTHLQVDGHEEDVSTTTTSTRSRSKDRSPGHAGATPAAARPLSLMYWGKFASTRQQPRRHRAVPSGLNQRRDARPEPVHGPRSSRSPRSTQTYLYSYDGTGPYDDALDPMIVDRVVDFPPEERRG